MLPSFSLRRLWLVVRIVWPLLLTVVCTVLIASESIRILSAVRAYAVGESLWSKGQKDALFFVAKYAQTGDEADYQHFQESLAIPLGDHRARLALERAEPDLEEARAGFLAGGNDPNDVDGLIMVFLRFRNVSFMKDAIDKWREGDVKLLELEKAGLALHAAVTHPAGVDQPTVERELARVARLNKELTPLETAFSQSLGRASRIVQQLLAVAVFGSAAILVPIGLLFIQRLLERTERERSEQEAERVRHRAIRTILDNVPYGLLMCDRRGRVLDGYSSSLCQFFPDAGELEGRRFVDLLGFDPNRAAYFDMCWEQVFDDVLPVELALGQLPTRVRVEARHFAITGSVIRASDGVVTAVLLTVLDIGALIEAEHEVEHMHGVLQVLRHRSRFDEWIRELDDTLLHAISLPAWDESLVRRELHTAKGVFGQFRLRELASAIHALEDREVIQREDLACIRAAIHALLLQNEPYWNIRLNRIEHTHAVSEVTLERIESKLASATTLDEARAVVADLGRIRERTVAQLLGPIEESCADHALERGKSVKLVVAGANATCPMALAPVFTVVSHLVRNSIDHGIELPEERGDKPADASICIEVRRTQSELTVSVTDDGNGIDTDALGALMVERELYTEDEVARMSEQERFELIFAPGISTSLEVSRTSGRGVGMSAFKSVVEELGGSVEVSSSRGVGTDILARFSLEDVHLRRAA